MIGDHRNGDTMQTFLPYPDFQMSARCLDNKRLGKQRVEAWQIFRAIVYGGGWRHHPAVALWRDNIGALLLYGRAMCVEWRSRGFQDTMLERFDAIINYCTPDFTYPKWFGNEDFHNSHKSNLLRKDYSYYSKFGWQVPDNLPYRWS